MGTENLGMTRGLHPLSADVIVGHGDRKKDVKGVHPTISDADLALEVDRMKFDQGDTAIWLQKWTWNRRPPAEGPLWRLWSRG